MALPAGGAGGGSNLSPPPQIPLHDAGAHHDLRNARDVVGGHAVDGGVRESGRRARGPVAREVLELPEPLGGVGRVENS